jgi:hypothetical protein
MFCGNVFCLMAVSDVCTCRCEGEWHGAGRISAGQSPVNYIIATPREAPAQTGHAD